MESMMVRVIVHKQLPAREILNNDLWRANYCYFSGGNRGSGIYFYLYGSSSIPFYIGMCAAKSYNILGRVWNELDDYRNGKYYLPKNPEKLSSLECFTKASSHETFFIPGKYDKEDDAFLKALDTMLNNTRILFSYLETDPQVDHEQMINVIYNIEALFQRNVVDTLKLEPKWIGDKGRGYFVDPQFDYTLGSVYEDPGLANILDTELLLGRRSSGT